MAARDDGADAPDRVWSSSICLLTPPGRAAVAMLRFEGDLGALAAPPPLVRLRSGRPLDRLPTGRVVLAHWGDESPEEVVLCRLDPRVLEIHCHGGRAAIERIVHDCRRRGAAIESPDELLARTLPWLEAECQRALQGATTERTAMILVEQANGVLRTELDAIRRLGAAAEAIGRLDRLLDWSDFGVHLTRPWSAVLCGRPNVGKSSLMNALAGYVRAIVSPQPGTTRDVVTADIVLDGWPIELSDTAGLRASDDPLESTGIERGRARTASADLRVVLVDVSQPPTADDAALLTDHPRGLRVAHKCDLPDRWSGRLPEDSLRVSSLTGEGLAGLLVALAQRLVPRLPAPGQAIPVTEAMVRRLRRIRSLQATGAAAQLDAAWRELLDTPQERGMPSASEPE